MHADHMHNFSLLMISKNVTWGIIFKSDFTKKGVSGWTAVCFSSYSDARNARWAWLRPVPSQSRCRPFCGQLVKTDLRKISWCARNWESSYLLWNSHPLLVAKQAKGSRDVRCSAQGFLLPTLTLCPPTDTSGSHPPHSTSLGPSTAALYCAYRVQVGVKGLFGVTSLLWHFDSFGPEITHMEISGQALVVSSQGLQTQLGKDALPRGVQGLSQQE